MQKKKVNILRSIEFHNYTLILIQNSSSKLIDTKKNHRIVFKKRNTIEFYNLYIIRFNYQKYPKYYIYLQKKIPNPEIQKIMKLWICSIYAIVLCNFFFFFFATRNHFKKMKSILENFTLHYNSIRIKNTKKKSSNKNCFFL